MADEEEEEMQLITAEIPQSIHQGVKRKLEYGGITREIRDHLRRIAVGEDMNQRSRLERELKELREERQELRADRRELDTKLENIETRINGIQADISQLTSKEERYEAKLEGLEYDLRADGMRMDPNNPKVENLAMEVQREPEAVVKDLKDRNPDVPEYAFEQVMHTTESWDGVPEDDISLDVDERDARYR